MSDAVRHFSRHDIDGVRLQVIADTEDGLDRIIAGERAVISEFRRHVDWPCKWLNLFVFDDLDPLIDQISDNAVLPPAEARALAQRPMVHIYNLADPAESTIFVNRGLMARQGLWADALALRGLLAHEHAHPLAENATTRAVRDLRFEAAFDEVGGVDVAPFVHAPAHELCLHAPQEVFSNELAIRIGFGDALMRLNRIFIGDARRAVAGRDELAGRLDAAGKAGRLSPRAASVLLLLASVHACGRFALETAAFARAGQKERARALETMLEDGVFRRFEPELEPLYRGLYERYLALTPDMAAKSVRDWAEATFAPLAARIDGAGLAARVHFRIAGDGAPATRATGPTMRAIDEVLP